MTDRATRFTECWHSEAPGVARYARRHVGAHDASDVVAETFLQAWRRWEEVPTPAFPWLLATARHIIGNQRRAARRRMALQERLKLLDGAARSAADTAVLAADRREALRSLAELSEEHREALLLIAWDGLSTRDAAHVLGVREGTFRARLSRARSVLERAQRDTQCRNAVAPTPVQQGN